jgi:hypothetical protein
MMLCLSTELRLLLPSKIMPCFDLSRRVFFLLRFHRLDLMFPYVVVMKTNHIPMKRNPRSKFLGVLNRRPCSSCNFQTATIQDNLSSRTNTIQGTATKVEETPKQESMHQQKRTELVSYPARCATAPRTETPTTKIRK